VSPPTFASIERYDPTANKRGTIEFATPAGGRISVLGLRFTPPNNALTMIPALANVGTGGGSIAHLASGRDGWQTTFVLVNTQPSRYADLIRTMQATHAEYMQIWYLFAFKPEMTVHLARFSQALLREPAPLSPGIRELIAAYTSALNRCAFCTKAHVGFAAALLEKERGNQRRGIR